MHCCSQLLNRSDRRFISDLLLCFGLLALAGIDLRGGDGRTLPQHRSMPVAHGPHTLPPALPPALPPTLPHPMPDGHIDRDVQILVHDRAVAIDVRMAASDVTWIEIIRSAQARTAAAIAQQSATQQLADPATQIQVEAEIAALQPLPDTEEAVAAWLVHDPNRRLLEQWLASTCRLEWCETRVPLAMAVVSRPDSRHHWSITFQLKYSLAGPADAGELRWLQVAYQDYPGKVRRAL